jgi:adenine-specific DNA glycosylase
MALAQIRHGLLQWYDEHHRVLPWRRNLHSKRVSQEGDLCGAPLDLPLDEFMYYVMVCEVCRKILSCSACNMSSHLIFHLPRS